MTSPLRGRPGRPVVRSAAWPAPPIEAISLPDTEEQPRLLLESQLHPQEGAGRNPTFIRSTRETHFSLIDKPPPYTRIPRAKQEGRIYHSSRQPHVRVRGQPSVDYLMPLLRVCGHTRPAFPQQHLFCRSRETAIKTVDYPLCLLPKTNYYQWEMRRLYFLIRER